MRLLFGLFQQLFTQGTERRNFAGLRLLPVNSVGTTVDNGFMMSTYAVWVNLFNQRHNKLRLIDNRVVVAVALDHIHSVDTVTAARRNMNHRSVLSDGLHKWRVFSLRVADDNIVLGGKRQKDNEQFSKKRLAGAGDS